MRHFIFSVFALNCIQYEVIKLYSVALKYQIWKRHVGNKNSI